MKGLELARSYHDVYVSALFEGLPGDVRYRAATGLVGPGSECLGFDDDISQDHDFGPGFCVWLPRDLFNAYAFEIQRRYDALPKTYAGYTRQTTELAGKRVGVFEIESFYRGFTGLERAPQTAKEWLAIPEQFLAVATGGEVFCDPSGEFSAIRNAYLSFYPDEVVRKKFAANCAVMAQAGQYNLPRTIARHDAVAANTARSEFLTAALAVMHLLHRVYMPFYKWSYRSLTERVRAAAPIAQAVADIAAAPVTELDQELVESLCVVIASTSRAQGWSDTASDFLLDTATQIWHSLSDPYLSACPLNAGAYR